MTRRKKRALKQVYLQRQFDLVVTGYGIIDFFLVYLIFFLLKVFPPIFSTFIKFVIFFRKHWLGSNGWVMKHTDFWMKENMCSLPLRRPLVCIDIYFYSRIGTLCKSSWLPHTSSFEKAHFFMFKIMITTWRIST